MTDRSLSERIDEVVLGLASETEMAEIEALCAADADIAAQLERARSRFAALDDTADIMPLPDDLWQRVETSLDAKEPDGSSAAQSADIIKLVPLQKAVSKWRATALSGLAAALLLAVGLGWSLLNVAEPTIIAVLLDSQGQPIALVEGNDNNKTLITLLENARVPDDRVMQVWTKPEEDGSPVSLGLLAAARSRTLSVDGLPPPRADQLYEITYEPLGGSPTNLPTGPILGKGFAKLPVY
ncbi:anti-sigma factor [Hoeflea sp. AS60]|uniref:anti-sigma factor n=1 Tax=Hoeflea sp. AS60 TaxID=3135780 RepID=UPI0031752F66